MIDRQSLLSDLQKLLRQLETDLRERCDEAPAIDDALRSEYDAARQAERTAETFEEWRADYITQIAVAWVLTCVFARFLEDNCLVDPPKLSGPGDRLRRAGMSTNCISVPIRRRPIASTCWRSSMDWPGCRTARAFSPGTIRCGSNRLAERRRGPDAA